MLRDSTESSTGTRKLIILRKPLQFVGPGRSAVVLDFLEPTSIADLWTTLVPHYGSFQWKGLLFRVRWDPKYAIRMRQISENRIEKRRVGYINDEEIQRAKRKLHKKGSGSIRFGCVKTGLGIKGERGDFCLVGGTVWGGKTFMDMTVLYRNLEMQGGFAYDLELFHLLERKLERPIRYLTVLAHRAHTMGAKGNSNEKLHPQLRDLIFKD